ncbi:hypothetical protein C8R46DRAFT_1301120 [Mycena filopes]|nr:hypothetical protein C8R46DRAFT_1301120 [Mycena filopes]
MNELPVEIRDKIIDYSKSRRTLAACSLVCSAWTDRAGYHLFRKLWLRLRVTYQNAPVIHDLLWSPLRTIIPNIRRLTLVNNGDYAQAFEDIDRELVKFDSLRLSGSSWVVNGWDAGLGFTANPPTVVDLEIDCPDLDQALLIICAFPCLRRLSVRKLRRSALAEVDSPFLQYAPPDSFRQTTPVAPGPLSSLYIHAPATPSVLSWLNWTGSRHLTYLELHITWYHATNYLHKLSHSLEHLGIGGWPLHTPPIIPPRIPSLLAAGAEAVRLRTRADTDNPRPHVPRACKGVVRIQ